MKSLYDYIKNVFEEEGGASAGASAATPANTMGMGNPSTDEMISAPFGGIPRGDTRITPRRKKRKKGKRDYPMTGPTHNT